MLMITAVVQPFRLSHIVSELLASGIEGLTVYECAGHGRDAKLVPSLQGEGDVIFLESNLRIEVAVPDESRDAAVGAITRGARLGGSGPGKIFVATVERVIAIRTGLDDDLAYTASPSWIEAAE
jgi:nitrogen regulatory protein P-II 1